MRFADYQDVVKDFFSCCSDPALRVGIGIGCLQGSGHDVRLLRLENGIKSIGVLLVVISNQALKAGIGFLELPNELSGLLSHPMAIWMTGDTG